MRPKMALLFVVGLGAAGSCSSEPVCGNDVVEDGERCDGNCPTACVAAAACMTAAVVGDSAGCSAHCEETPLATCVDGDGCCPAGCGATGDTDCVVCSAGPPAGVRVSLPADDAPHFSDIEWWYWTGHLQTETGRQFGFQLVYFLAQYGGFWAHAVHQALTDVQAGAFHFADDAGANRPQTVSTGYLLAMPLASAQGGDGFDVLHSSVDGLVLDLELGAVKAPVYQYGVGYVDYPFGGNTYYYSRERMDATGTLTIGQDKLKVTGDAWFDHQWGQLSDARAMGWDWFALSLDDDREIMVFIIRSTPVMVGGSYTDAGCQTQPIQEGDVSITATGAWVSPHTGRTYPSGWDIQVLGMQFHVEPLLDDQELNVSVPPPGVAYWEGACAVTGDATGKAYVELTGY
ncbi:MAG: carotenoid 1,2-hydratase [Deltaproteobacteria bacterium]|nr:carotenoid 1,2-hydratase [Deltaproteobacteria bacterium]